MTLRGMIEAVSAGTLKTTDLVILGPQEHADAWNAYNGSLDAAKRLHDALLPGWEWTLHQNGAAIVRRDKGSKPYGVPIRNTEAMDPARAFLLAILRALEGEP